MGEVNKMTTSADVVIFSMEQGTGIEPAFTAWEAVVLPIYEPCVGLYYSRVRWEIQVFFVETVAHIKKI